MPGKGDIAKIPRASEAMDLRGEPTIITLLR